MTRTESLESLRANLTEEENYLVGLGILNAWAGRMRKGYLVCGPLTDETNLHGANAVEAIRADEQPKGYPTGAAYTTQVYYIQCEARLAFRAALAAVGLKSL